MTPDRRTFLKRSATVVSAAMIADTPDAVSADAAELAAARPASLDGELLRAVAEAVLPESLGRSGQEAAVRRFEAWWAGFEPEAELVHPYGGWIIPYGPPDREPEWSAQLAELEAAALGTHDEAFTELSVQVRRALISADVKDEGPAFPRPAEAEHVVVALMAHYFGSADAANRCYGREIDKLECRTTVTVGELPPPISQ